MPVIYSSHHQAAKDIGEGLEVTALSPDGKVVEGLAHKQYPNVFAVQFHPEVPALYENRELWKFSPGETPETFHKMLDRKSLKFHKKYWKNISGIIGSLDNSIKE
jgi:putative glutamine amidotransferase